MISGKGSKIFQEVMKSSFESTSEREFDLSKIVTPFSKIFKSYKPSDIYSGAEKIPFKKRDLEYKMILKQEFANFLKQL